MEPVITLEHLVKSFGSVQALRGLSLEMPPGPIGLLGPNGAGKTTLIQILLGLLQPDSGAATIAGFHPSDPGERLDLRLHNQRAGYLIERHGRAAASDAPDPRHSRRAGEIREAQHETIRQDLTTDLPTGISGRMDVDVKGSGE